MLQWAYPSLQYMTTKIAKQTTSSLLSRQDPRSQTRIEPVSRSVGHHPKISPRTVALALGVSALARDSTE
ncbi:hypothetical protein VZT92_007803 [Zoarces viviparus]|uniref:Uncharacterized protein n=1 Tax=Zoarces viviparus TaxID=48416 RepID=A0AAW1FL39_ZOAVI